MDYQPTVDQMNQESSKSAWYAIIIVAIAVALAFWYFSGNQFFSKSQSQDNSEQAQLPSLSEGNTTADIANDLNQIQDVSAVLEADAASSAQSVEGF